jgi:hypothetical protein
MTFSQQNRAFWAENIRAVKAQGRTLAGFDLEHQRQWALRCLAMPGPVGRLPG